MNEYAQVARSDCPGSSYEVPLPQRQDLTANQPGNICPGDNADSQKDCESKFINEIEPFIEIEELTY